MSILTSIICVGGVVGYLKNFTATDTATDGGKVNGLAIDFDQIDLFGKLIHYYTNLQRSVEVSTF
jgi:hypothetical protein